MAYFAPYIDESGLHIPTYQDIEDSLVNSARTIFGTDIYLENDSQDFQDIAARAQLIYDTLLTAQMAYNARSPVFATGVSLDGLVALNGILRHPATRSIATVTLTGTAYTLISSGVVADINGNLWNLPSSVTIGAGGTVDVTATCQASGAITALAGQINIISTPTLGWTAVNNAGAATPGQPVETDSSLRARQAESVANPSQALTYGILGGVLAVTNVLSAQLYENDTASPVSYVNGVFNPSGYPPHSITMVVDGGAQEDIANAIAVRKTPGCYTNGDVAVTTYDPAGVPTVIRFYRPTLVPIQTTLTVAALRGYSSAVTAAIKQAVFDYVNGLVAGQTVVISEIWQAALSVDLNPPGSPTFSLNSVTANRVGDPPVTTNLAMNYVEKATITLLNINVVVV